MTRPKNPRELTDAEIETVRMVARGWADERIAAATGCSISTIQGRINLIYHLLGIPIGAKSNRGITRALLVIWAYENGVASARGSQRSARERELEQRAFGVCRQLVHKRPYPVVRAEAVAIIREADDGLVADEAPRAA